MAQTPLYRKATIAKQAQSQADTAAGKRPQGDSYFDEYFQNPQSHQLDTPSEPEQQRQWISDQLMWETTLGLREDDTINRVITPDSEESAAHNSQRSSAPKQLSETERQLLRTQFVEPAASPPTTDTYHAQPQPRITPLQKPSGATAHEKQIPAQTASQRPSTPPHASHPRQAESSHCSTQPVTPSSSSKSSAATANKASVRRVQPRTAAHPVVRSVQQSGQNDPAAPRSDATTAPGSIRPGQDTTVQRQPHSQTQPVAKRIGDNTVILLDTPVPPRSREEHCDDKYSQWARKIAAVLSIAITSFIGGYYLGDRSADEAQVARLLEAMKKARSEQNDVNQPQKPHASLGQTKPKRKPAVVERKSAERSSKEENEAKSSPDVKQPGSAAVFEGRDIPVDSSPVNGSKETANSTDTTIDNTADTTAIATGPAQSGNSTGEQDDIPKLLTQSLQAFNSKQWQTLVDLSNKILAIDSTTVNALTNRAAAYTELNMYGLALKDCNTVIKMDANNALAFNNRGYVYEKMGDMQNAVADYQTACNLGVALSCKEASHLKQNAP